MRAAGSPDARLGWLIKRSDYLAMQQPDAKRWSTPFFVLQVRPLKDTSEFAWRVGFTTSRKVGNAVTRNRARRRLRELVRQHVPGLMQPGYDLVFIGRTAAASVPFPLLLQHFEQAVQRLKLGR